MIVGIFSHVALAILTFSGSVVVPFGAHRLRAAQMAAPTKTPELPAVDTVLEKYVAATGGKEAIEKIKTITARGSISLPAIQREGSIEFYRAAPNKYLFLASITGFGLMEQCFDGKTGWSKSPKMGIRNVAAAELGQAKREADMYAPLHLKQMYSSMVVKGIEKIDQRNAYLIEAAPPEGGPEELYFDQSTGLLVRIDQSVVTPLGSEPMQVYYEDFRDVNGVKIPFKRTQVTQGITTLVTLREVQANVPVDESRFQRPKDSAIQQ